MLSGMRPERAPECISDLRFDAWFAGELAQHDASSLRSHVAGCKRCTTREAALLHQRKQFAATHGTAPSWLAGTRKRRTRFTRRLLVGSVAACACALLAIAMREAPGVRSKGSEAVGFYVKRGEHVLRGSSRLILQPGDKLRFVYTSTHPGYLAILSLDSELHATVYYPAGDRAAPIAPGVDAALPSAIELDATLGEERIIALFCADPVQLAPLRDELAAKQRLETPPKGCSVERLRLLKAAEPK